MGFPLIRIRIENRTVKVTQERFLLNPYENRSEELSRSQSEYRWYVPLSYITDLQPRSMKIVWLNMTEYCKSAVFSVFYFFR